jgi:hypothetical protein
VLLIIRRLRTFSYIFFVALFPLQGFAQVNTASLTGSVTDQSSAVVGEAKVTALNLATNVTHTTVTDSSGYYFFPSLPIGEYDVTVEKQAFERVAYRLKLDPAEKGRQDFELHVGSSSENVTVQAEGLRLSTEDASLGAVVGNTTITETPLYLRNWDDLLRLVPGVQANRYTDQSGATSAGRTGGFNVHGVHSLQNNFILDGVDNNSISENVQELTTQVSRPSVDAIEEFKVITNPYSAEYGRSPGGAVVINTKGGTNAIHGLAFEYLRNRVFDANDFFSNRSGLDKPQNTQNQFGGDLGAPIIKDKLFGFFAYEGTRIRRGVSRISTVPLPNERIGDFSPTAAAAAGVTYPTIVDPATGLPFPNNQIPADRIDPFMTKIMTLFPQPNLSGQLNNFARNASLSDGNDSYNGRIDWIATSADTVFGRYSYSDRSRFIPGFFGGIGDGTSTSAWGRQTLKAHNFVLGWTHIFSPRLANEFRAGFSRNYSYARQDPFGANHTSDFVPGVPQNPAVDGGISQITFTDFTFIGSPDFLPKSQVPQQWQWIDNLSLTTGRHALKFGADLRTPMRNIFQDEPGTRGSLTFDKTFTGLTYADALLGYVKNAQLTNVFFVDQRFRMLSGFVQDDFKATRHLTLNLGLRYDFATPALEGQNRMANFDPSGSGSVLHASSGSLEDRALVTTSYRNFAPRVGLAYALGDKTVIRGGYGIYYLLFERYGSENQLALNPPSLINNVVTSSGGSPVFFLRDGFPSDFLDPASLDLSRVRIRAVNPELNVPYVQQWSFGIQRELPWNFVGELNYVGTKSTHLDVLSDFNQPIAGVKPYSNFGYIEYMNSIGSGVYHGLEGMLDRRFQNGLSFRLSYTYSRSIDNTPEELSANSGAAQNGRDYDSWRGPSDFDTPHRVAVSYVYEFPFGPHKQFLKTGPLSYILGGFHTSGVYTYASGRPFTVNSGGTIGSSIDPFGAATAVPNIIGTPTVVGTPDCWYYAAQNAACQAAAPGLSDAFELQSPGEFGNASRNLLRGPHTNVFDFALIRDFVFTERTKLAFRWEVFNLTNTPLFGQPNNNFSSSAAGRITTLAGDPRVMQFALRLSF